MNVKYGKRIIGIYPIFFCYAFYLSMLGQLVPYMQAKYAIDLSSTGMFSTLQSIGGIAAVMICVLYLDWVNKPKLLSLLGAAFALLMVGLGLVQSIGLVYLLFLFIGFVNSLVYALSNAVVSDHTMQKRGIYLNLLHGFYGLGGAVGSQVTRLLFDSIGMEQAFVCFGVFAFFCAGLYMMSARQELSSRLIIAKQPSAIRLRLLKQVFKKPGMVLVMLVSFFNAFVLINVLYFTYSFVYSMSGQHIMSALALTVFFVFMTLSRFAASGLTKRRAPKQFLFYGSLLGAVAYVIAAVSAVPAVAVILLGMAGFFTGNNMPQIMSAACAIEPENTAAASGLVTLGYFVATIIAPPIIGWTGDSFGLKTALLINALMLIPAAVFAGFMKQSKAVCADKQSRFYLT